jgi:hypothetical protein
MIGVLAATVRRRNYYFGAVGYGSR